jgi:DNA polymerase-3 subunit gamma/tau
VAYQSLYRRYRSQKFSELRGQHHVTTALKSAVAEGRYGHAYLFSGPRGTGKTSTARILAKALNCPNVVDGEPCGECESCEAIEGTKSFDLFELDAASHNKVDDVRDLISKVNLGSPGRTKVYILDEVHMLSSGAENALLKTLEEPPDHVVFVLATTEPHKVVPTIRSRTQHFRFELLPAAELEEHVRYVIDDAGLDVSDDAIDWVLTQGGGSARDTLSALDLVVAAGGVPAGSDVGTDLTRALGAGDPAGAIAAIQNGLVAGQEPRVIGEATVEVLRNAFLAAMGASLDHLNDRTRELTTELASELGPATITRALEALGSALVDMRQAPDPRVPLEVAVLRVARAKAGGGPAAAPQASDGTPTETSAASGMPSAEVSGLVARIEALEKTVADLQAQLDAGAAPSADSGPAPRSAPAPKPRPAPTDTAAPAPSTPEKATPRKAGPAAAARSRLAEATGQSGQTASAPPDSSAAPGSSSAKPPSRSASAPAGGDEQTPAASNDGPAGINPKASTGLTSALTQSSVEAAYKTVLDTVSQKTRVRFNSTAVLAVEGSTVTVGVPNAHYVDRCADRKDEVEQALSSHFGQAVTVSIVVDTQNPPPTLDVAKVEPKARPAADADEDIGPIDELVDATDQDADDIDRLTKAFPGSKVIESD